MPLESLENRLLQSLLAQYGYVMGSAGLRQAMGFPSQAALRHAIAQKSLPFSTFPIDGRKGQFALTHDVVAWLVSRGALLSPETTAFSKPRSTEQTAALASKTARRHKKKSPRATGGEVLPKTLT